MRVTINGKEQTVPAGLTIAGLLAAQGADARRVAVEVNHDVVPRGEYERTPVREGDRIEIVTFVGGG